MKRESVLSLPSAGQGTIQARKPQVRRTKGRKASSLPTSQEYRYLGLTETWVGNSRDSGKPESLVEIALAAHKSAE